MWIVIGAKLGAIGVALGAFGAHALPGWLETQARGAEMTARVIASFETAVRYQMYHALALVLVGLLARTSPSRLLDASGVAFLLGVIVFSGMLYLWVLTATKAFALVVPIGGVAFIVGWALLALAAWKAD
jgi:uncharacterized membrane protein YgdD (TMEM256/DUF423 family)